MLPFSKNTVTHKKSVQKFMVHMSLENDPGVEFRVPTRLLFSLIFHESGSKGRIQNWIYITVNTVT